jgi:hypothetical protein
MIHPGGLDSPLSQSFSKSKMYWGQTLTWQRIRAQKESHKAGDLSLIGQEVFISGIFF